MSRITTTASRILLVEDCAEQRSIVGATLADFCTVVPAESVADARRKMSDGRYDLILLDIELPDGTGYDLCSDLRDPGDPNGKPRIPVIFLTGRSDYEEVAYGFLAGGTDYVVKPFRPDELRGRIEARLRQLRSPGPAGASPPTLRDWIVIGNLRIDFLQRRVEEIMPEGNRDLELTPSEYKLLAHLVRHPATTLSRERLLSEVWSAGSEPVSDRAIDVHICQLRKKLPVGPCRIDAIYGAGYRFVNLQA